MLKEPRTTWLMRERKSIIESSTSSRFFADLHSFSQSWIPRIDREEEFGRKLFVEALFCFEGGLVVVHHVQKSSETLGSNV
jgi:hypothetical protein